MYKNTYLNKLFFEVVTKYTEQKEFLDAVEEFLDSMDTLLENDPSIEQSGVLERLLVPERIIMFRVAWLDDNNKIRVNTGYRVQHSSAIGPYKGGLRFEPSVKLSILKGLAFEQTFKNSLTGLPLGGAKGGSDFTPKGKSDQEIMRFCQAFMGELYRHIGPDTDIPAGDFGVGAQEIGYLFGYYKKLKNEFSGVLTGKGIAYGGSLIRPEATGYGLLYFVEEMLKTYYKSDIKGKRIVISGNGKVGSMAALKAKEMGAIIVGMSASKGYVADPNGLDVDLIIDIAKRKGSLMQDYIKVYPDVLHGEAINNLWNIPCDIALPCATQEEIKIDAAKSLKANGCMLVAEGANMPTTLEAVKYFYENGILFAPGKAANAGGVAVSGLEMSQNALHLSWSEEEVDAKLKDIMIGIFKKCHETAIKYGQPSNLALGANIAGFLKVYEAMLAQGVV